MLAGETGGSEFVLYGLNCHLAAVAADDFSGGYELHRGDVVQQDRPRDRQFHIEAFR